MSARVVVLAASVFGCMACSRGEPPSVLEENARRDAFGNRMLDVEDAGRSRLVSSNPEVVFEQGFSQVLHDPPSSFRNHAFRWVGRSAHVRLKSHGDKPMRVLARGWFDEKALRTRAFMTFFLDGRVLGETLPVDEKGHYWGEFVVPRELLRDREWVDLTMVPSTIAFHWAEPPQL